MATQSVPPRRASRADDSTMSRLPGARHLDRDGDGKIGLDDFGLPHDAADRAVRHAGPWVEKLGRIGLTTKGVVYLFIGVLAAQAAIGAGGQTTDTRGALLHILEQPFGTIALGFAAVGLVGFALWRVVQALLDTEHKGTELKGLGARAGYVVSAVAYSTLAFFAVKLLLGLDAGADGESATRDWTAWLMGQPFGRWLVGAAGLGFLWSAAFQLWRAWSTDFRKKLALDEIQEPYETWIIRAGRLGFAARGVAFAIIGAFLVLAAWHAQPEEARGLGGALATLAEQPFGPWLLGVVAVGLVAYGLYMIAEGRYRRIDID